jgi:CPA1 family monovalent cation:H+ antiporter
LASFADDDSAAAERARKELRGRLGSAAPAAGQQGDAPPPHVGLYRHALQAARQAVIDLRDREEIGDDAFHALENELDWLELSDLLRSKH